eukprot:6173612-Pleurochrysis_carterae.AAC.2
MLHSSQAQGPGCSWSCRTSVESRITVTSAPQSDITVRASKSRNISFFESALLCQRYDLNCSGMPIMACLAMPCGWNDRPKSATKYD